MIDDVDAPTPAIAMLVDSIAPHVLGWSLVVSRIAGLVVIAPLVSSAIIPMRVRATLCLMLACAAYPMLATSGMPQIRTDLFGLVPLVLAEGLIGFAIGAIAATPLLMMEMAGIVAGTTMGLGLARVYDHSQDADVDLLGQFFFFLAMAIFFSLGGVESLFRGLLMTFDRVPVGAGASVFASTGNATSLFAGIVSSGMEIALRISAPVIAIVFLVIVLIGVIGKTMPAINVLSIGFAIKVGLGTTMIATGLYAIREPIADGLHEALEAVGTWIQGLNVANVANAQAGAGGMTP